MFVQENKRALSSLLYPLSSKIGRNLSYSQEQPRPESGCPRPGGPKFGGLRKMEPNRPNGTFGVGREITSDLGGELPDPRLLRIRPGKS